MNRPTRSIAAVLLAGVMISGATSALADTTKLRVHLWASPKHLINSEIVPVWCGQVKEATEGRVECDISYPPNADPTAMFDRVKNGIADVAWGLHSYTRGRFVLSEIAELPGVEANSEAMTRAFWRTHERHLAAADEHRGVKLVGLMLTAPGAFQTRHAINGMDDIRDHKMRVAGGVAARVAKQLDIVGVAAPATKVYELLQQGVIGGALLPPETSLSFKLREVTSHMTLVPGGLYYTSFFLVMNEDTFNDLSPEDQKAVMAVSGENYATIAGKVFDKWDPIGIKAAKEAGVEVVTASDELTAKINERTAPIIDAWVEEANGKGIDGRAALEFFRSETQKLYDGN